MKLLVLGGTKFLGRAVVEAALERGHEPTLFNRGLTSPGLFSGVEELHGDRDGGLGALAGRTWDAVVDTSGYVPRVVRASAEALRGAVGHYVFVSTLSVYAWPLPAGVEETAPLAPLAEETEEVTGESYGPLKALCEAAVHDVFPGASASIRAGLIVGPHDPSGRFTYWPVRVARGGEVLAPGDPERPVQFVDVRDLATWLVSVAERRLAGTFNAVGRPLPMRELLETARRVSGSDATFTWVPDDYLLAERVGEWLELPLWLTGADAPFLQVNADKAFSAGLATRPLAETVADTLAWAGDDVRGKAGMGPARERRILYSWHRFSRR